MPEYKNEFLIVKTNFKTGRGKDKKAEYKATITYSNLEEMRECAVRYTKWALQKLANDKSYPNGHVFESDGKGRIRRSISEQATELAERAKNDEQVSEVLLRALVAAGKLPKEILGMLNAKSVAASTPEPSEEEIPEEDSEEMEEEDSDTPLLSEEEIADRVELLGAMTPRELNAFAQEHDVTYRGIGRKRLIQTLAENADIEI